MILSTLVIGVPGISQRGNDRAGNPYFFVCNLLECKECKYESNWCVYQPPPVFRRCPLIDDRASSWSCRSTVGLAAWSVDGRTFLVGN